MKLNGKIILPINVIGSSKLFFSNQKHSSLETAGFLRKKVENLNLVNTIFLKKYPELYYL